MREIKFRAWDKKCIEVYGTGMSYGEPEYFDDMLAFRFNHFESDNPSEIIYEQFTGLHDATKWADLTESEREAWTRNGGMPSKWMGKEIYEGDICRIVRYNGELQTSGDIFFDKGEFRITNGYDVADTDSLGRFKADIVEVIGNIHEHSHLLK